MPLNKETKPSQQHSFVYTDFNDSEYSMLIVLFAQSQ